MFKTIGKWALNSGKYWLSHLAFISFIIGLITSISLGRYIIIILITFVLGIIITNSKFFKPQVSTIFIINAITMLIGLLLFITATSRYTVTISFIIGILLGKQLKNKLN